MTCFSSELPHFYVSCGLVISSPRYTRCGFKTYIWNLYSISKPQHKPPVMPRSPKFLSQTFPPQKSTKSPDNATWVYTIIIRQLSPEHFQFVATFSVPLSSVPFVSGMFFETQIWRDTCSLRWSHSISVSKMDQTVLSVVKTGPSWTLNPKYRSRNTEIRL